MAMAPRSPSLSASLSGSGFDSRSITRSRECASFQVSPSIWQIFKWRGNATRLQLSTLHLSMRGKAIRFVSLRFVYEFVELFIYSLFGLHYFYELYLAGLCRLDWSLEHSTVSVACCRLLVAGCSWVARHLGFVCCRSN